MPDPEQFNQPIAAPEVDAEKETFRHEEQVQFRDGEVGLLFRTQGDILKLGHGSDYRYAKSLGVHGIDTVIVHTKSGNDYEIGEGVVINAKKGKGYLLPEDMPELELGKPWTIPGVGSTSEVERVLFRYKNVGVKLPHAHQVDTDSPWEATTEKLRAVRRDQLNLH